ncbi:MAG TPA: hypothetical protein VFW25_00495 [Silvibacterium sp.]|nr:hypothetical protein [Silvibacterium sp.]
MASQPLPIPEQQTSSAVEYPASRRQTRGLAAQIPQYWHLLSLDAPTVASLWAWSLARALNIAIPADSLLLLFVGTWLLYIADRILDGLHKSPTRLRPRHLFYIRHRTAALLALIPATGLLTWLICAHMIPPARRADTAIIAIFAAYFSLVHLRKSKAESWFPKELIVAVVFAAATAVPAWTRLNSGLAPRVILLAIDILFGALCWLNCIAIEKWEQSRLFSKPAIIAPVRSGPNHNTVNMPLRSRLNLIPPAHITDGTTRWGQRRLRPICAAVALVALLAAYSIAFVPLFQISQLPAIAVCGAAAISAALLFALDYSPLPAHKLRIAADAALLTPILLLLVR